MWYVFLLFFDWDSCLKRCWKPHYTPVTAKQLHDHNLDRIGEKSNVHRCHKLPFDAKLKKKKKYKRPKELPKLLGRKNCEDYHEKIKHGMLIEWKNTTKSISNIFLSTWRRNCKNMQENWIHHGFLRADHELNWLLSYFAGSSKIHCGISIFMHVFAIPSLMSSVAHRFGQVEFWILNICFDFFHCVWRKQ